ncbi:MAG: thioesterase family protein [Paraglaciecola sp.]|uniref:acyl-CoA thioesterase n=1 Tax=Paraglaciecola sp. TaxID=1920173 RepID=UPI0032980D78
MPNIHSDLKSNFTVLMRVRYGECDAQQVVFNARYADYVDVAMTEYFREAVGGFQTLLDKGLDNQVVSLQIDWLSSARFDDVLEINVATNKVGNTSYSFELTIVNADSKINIANCRITYVMVDTKTYQKTPVPDWLRDKLCNAEPLPLVNQSGVIS